MTYYAELKTDEYIRENFFSDLSYIGTMVEVGAGPPEYISMSKHFRESGWRCICVDPNPKFVQQHKAVGSEIYQFACSSEEKDSTFKIVDSTKLHGWNENVDGVSISALELRQKVHDLPVHEIPVKVLTLNSLLEKLNIEKLDFVSIDTEGWEIEVMRGFDVDKYQPKVILLENFFNDAYYIQYMLERGYNLKHKIEYNYIFTK
jgi:FkbM family methyltransferase